MGNWFAKVGNFHCSAAQLITSDQLIGPDGIASAPTQRNTMKLKPEMQEFIKLFLDIVYPMLCLNSWKTLCFYSQALAHGNLSCLRPFSTHGVNMTDPLTWISKEKLLSFLHLNLKMNIKGEQSSVLIKEAVLFRMRCVCSLVCMSAGICPFKGIPIGPHQSTVTN